MTGGPEDDRQSWLWTPAGQRLVQVRRHAERRGGTRRRGMPKECIESRATRTVTGCGKLYRARSRLYRNEILQVNMRLKALVEIYTMHFFALH